MIIPPLASFSPAKTVLRERMRAVRRAARRDDAGAHAARRFIASAPLPEGAVVSLYHPIDDELDTAPLCAALAERGHPLALPVTPRGRAPLTFRRYAQGEPLVAGRKSLMEPPESAGEVSPDIIVTPLLAFTRDGDRLGYGGGYYDRTLAQLRAQKPILAVGFAYGAQEVDALPLGPLDQRLDWIITEREAIAVARR